MTDLTETRATDDAQQRLDDDGAPPPPHPEARRSRLRSIMARIDRALPATASLQVAWHELVATLDLGPEPVTTRCAQCGATVMRDATRCGHCWSFLTP